MGKAGFSFHERKTGKSFSAASSTRARALARSVNDNATGNALAGAIV